MLAVRHPLLAATALVALSGPASASSNMYVGLAGGLSQSKDSCVADKPCGRDHLAGKFTLGYFASQHVALELGLGKFGNARLTTLDDSRQTISRSTIGIGGALWGQFGNNLFGVARLGLASNKTDIQTVTLKGVSSDSGSRRSSPYAGAGLLYSLTPSLHLTGDLDLGQYKHQGGKVNVQALTMGVALKF